MLAVLTELALSFFIFWFIGYIILRAFGHTLLNLITEDRRTASRKLAAEMSFFIAIACAFIWFVGTHPSLFVRE
jgi:cellobiose-specific phosphotransferase system component IIC